MGKLIVYNFISVNGYFKGPNEDISWAKADSGEERTFAAEQFKTNNILIFGRVTYELMSSYWPTEQARKDTPKIAEGMNKAEKIVFSTKMDKADWNNTRLIKGDLGNEIRKLKELPGRDLTVLGSGSIVSQLMHLRLIDELQLMVHPVLIGGGTSILNDIMGKIDLRLIKTKKFKSGSVAHYYEPVFDFEPVFE